MQVLEHLLSAQMIQLQKYYGIRIINDMRNVHYVLLILFKACLNGLEI